MYRLSSCPRTANLNHFGPFNRQRSPQVASGTSKGYRQRWRNLPAVFLTPVLTSHEFSCPHLNHQYDKNCDQAMQPREPRFRNNRKQKKKEEIITDDPSYQRESFSSLNFLLWGSPELPRNSRKGSEERQGSTHPKCGPHECRKNSF